MDRFHEVLSQGFLGYIAGGARLERLDGGHLAATSGHQDHRDGGVLLADALHEPQAVEFGHLQIRDHQVDRVLLKLLERGAAVLGKQDVPRGGLFQKPGCQDPVGG